MTKLTSKELSDLIIEAIRNKKGENITRLDLRKTDGAICDYFVICQADNNRQVEAIADEIEDYVREKTREKPIHIEGRENAVWVLVDYVNVVVHVFLDECRNFYKIEDLWGDSNREDFENQTL